MKQIYLSGQAFAIIAILVVALALIAFSRSDDNRRAVPSVYAAAAVIPYASNPVVTELVNTTGAVITMERVAPGQYHISSSPPVFVVGRTIYWTHYYSMGPSATVQAAMVCNQIDLCRLSVYYSDPSGNSQFFYDGGTSGLAIPIKIEVYPLP